MKHLFYINELEKLNIKKDSSLFMALTLKKRGESVFLLLENELSISNVNEPLRFKVLEFKGHINEKFSIEDFSILSERQLELSSADIIHMRLDPPVDEGYLKALWMLKSIQDRGLANVVNSPDGILLNNEKLISFSDAKSIPTLVSSNLQTIIDFIKNLNISEIIIKPLNSFSGIGVEKILNDENIEGVLSEKVKGTIMVQPFIKEVYKGEIRTSFYQSKELGTILKIPKKGSYLSNIAQGANFHALELSEDLKGRCLKICDALSKAGIDFIAFDILNDVITEVNVTCPGLIVELSKAHKKNLTPDF